MADLDKHVIVLIGTSAGVHHELGSGRSWNVPNGPLELRDGEVHLWRVHLSNVQALPTLLPMLAPHELANGSRRRFERDRSRYLLAHCALRSIIARYLNNQPHELEFSYGLRGKPELASGAMHFNMSRSHDLAVVAIGRSGPIGVDIELVRDGVDEDVTRSFSPRAHHRLRALPKAARRLAFFRVWTRMEACAKARGEGLGASLHALDLFLDSRDGLRQPRHRAADTEGGWWLHDFSPQRGYAGALAVALADCTLRYWQWRPDIGSGQHRHSSSAGRESGNSIVMMMRRCGDENLPAQTHRGRLP